jgi:hypothetical protein
VHATPLSEQGRVHGGGGLTRMTSWLPLEVAGVCLCEPCASQMARLGEALMVVISLEYTTLRPPGPDSLLPIALGGWGRGTCRYRTVSSQGKKRFGDGHCR